MSLKLVSLASGSKGNCTLVLSDNTAILVDAGISYTRICKELKDFGLTPRMIDGILITHEHSDHIKALPKLDPFTKIYAHKLTAQQLVHKLGPLKNIQDVDFYENGFMIGDIKVCPYRIPHDAVYPLAYNFKLGKAQVGVATDIGMPTKGVLNHLKMSQVAILEANHDIEMLKNGKYSPWLKERILGTKGHLSNDDAALITKHLVGSEVQHLILGHLSENNNLPGLAYDTVNAVLKDSNSDIDLSVASQHSRSEVYETE